MKTINNNIQEDYVDFENAKLLKEKGFNIIGKHYYNDTPLLQTNEFSILHEAYRTQAPTIQLAVKWIYVNFGIWISVLECNDKSGFYWRIPEEAGPSSTTYNSPQEAYQAAIKHCLTELIQKK